MPQRKIKGIVLSRLQIKDHDTLLTVLADDGMKFTVNAAFVLSKRSKISAACQLFCYSEFVLKNFTGRERVDEACLVESFFSLANDVEAYVLACYFSELCRLFSDSDTAQPELCRLLLNTLYCLCHSGKPHKLIKFCFEVKLLAITGYMIVADDGIISYINKTDSKRIYSVDITDMVLSANAEFVEQTVCGHVAYVMQTLEFYKSLSGAVPQ